MITKFGKRFLTNHIAGNVDFNQKDLAFGIGSTTPNVLGNDTRLEFEFYRMPASLSSIDISQTGVDGNGNPIFSYNVIYKATIPQDVAGVISEVGLYPGSRGSINNYDSKFLTAFNTNLDWTDGSGNPQIQNNTKDVNGNYTFLSKIGDNMVAITAPSGTTKEYQLLLNTFDISGYSVNDSLAIAYKKADTNVTSIVVKFYTTNNDYYSISFTPTSGTGDKIQSKTLNNLFTNITGTPLSNNINKIGVAITSSGGDSTVYFDGIRINDEDTFDPYFGLISRSVFVSGNELIKPSGRPVDIEYKLSLGF